MSAKERVIFGSSALSAGAGDAITNVIPVKTGNHKYFMTTAFMVAPSA